MDIFNKPLTNKALSIGEKSVPFLIVAIHFSTSATLILSIFIALLWLASGRIKGTISTLKHVPAARYTLFLFAAFAISIAYSAAPYPQAVATLSKYRILLLLIILIPLINSEQKLKNCEDFLLIALIATLIISFTDYFSILPHDLTQHLLKSRITHGLFMAFLGFYSMQRLYKNKQHQAFWLAILVLTSINIFVITDGRTGQLTFLFLCALFFLQVFSFRTAFILGLATIAAFVVFLFFSPYSGRFFEGINESINFYNHDPSVEETSMGLRLGWWRDTLSIIEYSPWFGEGIGGLPYKFQQLFPNSALLVNPHNEFLLITAQLGLPGLLLFLAFLISVFRQSMHLPEPQRWLLQGVGLSLILSCLFNSSLLDHTEGHWFMALIALYSSPLTRIPNRAINCP